MWPNSITLSSSLAGREPACELDSTVEFGLYRAVPVYGSKSAKRGSLAVVVRWSARRVATRAGVISQNRSISLAWRRENRRDFVIVLCASAADGCIATAPCMRHQRSTKTTSRTARHSPSLATAAADDIGYWTTRGCHRRL